MEKTEAAKHKQWSGVFGTEWIPKWVYPDHIVKDGERVTIGDVSLKVHDIGSGGDCDANSIWLLEGDSKAAFIGDFVYSQNHTFMADGSILRWLANLELWASVLRPYKSYYVGHGPTCDYTALAAQREYLLNYSARLLEIAGNSATVSDEAKQALTNDLTQRYPGYGCQFMIGLSAPSVHAELRSKSLS
jgi:glyoxylase-like metal-dependent hydrolase (beta-lactamase superfamily II)